MSYLIQSGGFPFELSKHDQAPEVGVSTPLEAINNGNLGIAIQMLEDLIERGRASVEDCERLAWVKLETGDAAGAARGYRKLLSDNPHCEHTSYWREMANKAETTSRNGVAVLRPNGFEPYLQSRDPDLIAAYNLQSPHARVLVDEDWIEPRGYMPAIGLMRKTKNWLSGRLTDLFSPLGVGIQIAFAFLNTPDKPGLWTRLPKIGALAVLAHDRDRLLNSQKVPDGVKRDPEYVVPGYAKTGPTPDGAFADPKFPTAGTVGTPNPIHGPVDKKLDWSNDPRLPDPSKLAEAFGFRNGNMIKAPNLSAHVWAHLQQLVHDVLQTMQDDVRKYAVRSAAGTAEQRLGIEKVYYRADARDAKYGDMNGVTGAWDMSHIYGSSISTIDKVRTHPATGKLCPDGKLYLEGMNPEGRGGKWLPTEINAQGERQIVTGFNRNLTLPLLAEHTLYARHHNWVCDVLKSRHPDWHTNQIFQIARRVVTMTYVKIHTGAWTDTLFAHPAVVEGLHSNLYGRGERKRPFYLQRIFDPEGGDHPIVDGLAGNRKIADSIEVPEQKGKYFPIAYRFAHAIVNDYFDEESFKIGGSITGSGNRIFLSDVRDLDGHEFLKKCGLGSVYHSLMNTTMGAPTINNYADIFKRMPSEEGVLDLFQTEIAKDRQRGVGSYQQYRADHYLPEIRSYRDLFANPETRRSLEIIAKLEELYGEYNTATGKVDLDAMLGLLINENRPKGFAITNEGFQTFVVEASARIMKQPMLTTHWHPNDVGWTAINLVEAITKEKLIALHTDENPEMFEYLKNRHKPITFNDMSTDERGPLEAFIDFSNEHFHDLGLGAPWREEHFTGKGLENHYVTRITHEPTGTHYVVDVTEGRVYRDHTGDGRARARDAIADESVAGVSCDELIAAARAIRDSHGIAWPGARSPNHNEFVGGWRLSEAEVRKLKQWKGDKKDEGVAAKLTDIQKHTLVFNLAGSIDDASFSENLAGWKVLEKSGIMASGMAIMSSLRFGSPLSLSIGTGDAMLARRPTNSTKIFDEQGNTDCARLAHFRGQVAGLAALTQDGHISRDTFMKMLEDQEAVSFTTRKQWDSLFRLLARINGRPTITVENFDDLFTGKLLTDAFENFAPSEVVEQLAVAKRQRRPLTSAAAVPTEHASILEGPPGPPSHDQRITTAATLGNKPAGPAQRARSGPVDLSDLMKFGEPKLPIGSFEGTSPSVSGRNDRLVLQLQRDFRNPQGYYASLSEYTRRLPGFVGRLVPGLQLTSWVARMYPYYITHKSDYVYEVRTLRVAADGSLEVRPDSRPSILVLGKGKNAMKGAVLTRLGASGSVEKIDFHGGRAVTTWERNIIGNYFLAIDRSGGQYFERGINTVVTDTKMEFNTHHLMGQYKIRQHAEGLFFTLEPMKSHQLGAAAAKKMIGQGMDIVNWKPFRTTIEILLMNPEDPRDVKFFYERHDRDPKFSLKNLFLLMTRRLRGEMPMTREELPHQVANLSGD
ncbi:hypothetical protein IYY11_02595 [Methylocystis sp. H62]|uniref:peroxidase family protein n=1 Tax=Methylocystis sp. H62 TaxID=2785789 RepID=UPI0018C2551B|nr:peroxidase family protein [Methylocystis sp. H62]MBG0792346.1 hypothetical protein [Methylocystis sp. H62]